MGGYSENSFGWNVEQERFPVKLFSRDLYDRYYDIVVFGDSFSYKQSGEQTDIGSFWQNFLVNDTGLSLVTFNLNTCDLNNIVKSTVYMENPPRVFIYETVERDIVYAFPGISHVNRPEAFRGGGKPACPELLELRPMFYKSLFFDRTWIIKSNNCSKLDLGYAGNYLKKKILRGMLGVDTSRVERTYLTKGCFFSNRLSDEFLFYNVELMKQGWSLKLVEAARQKLLALQEMIQSKGQTFFIFFVAPDRTTAYSDYISDERFRNLSRIDEFSMEGLNHIRMDEKIRDAIKRGAMDVYMPNDTHWGSMGHRIASMAVKEYLIENSILSSSI